MSGGTKHHLWVCFIKVIPGGWSSRMQNFVSRKVHRRMCAHILCPGLNHSHAQNHEQILASIKGILLRFACVCFGIQYLNARMKGTKANSPRYQVDNGCQRWRHVHRQTARRRADREPPKNRVVTKAHGGLGGNKRGSCSLYTHTHTHTPSKRTS